MSKALLSIAKNVIYSSAGRMALKGGIQKNTEVIEQISTELREFLSANKGKHIDFEDIKTFSEQYFPKVKLNLINSKPYTGGVAACGENIDETSKQIESFKFYIKSQSPMDKIKSFLHIKNNKKELYVNNSFATNFIHEYTHFMQKYLKPIATAKERAYIKHHKDKQWRIGYGIDEGVADRDFVYKSEISYIPFLSGFNPDKFRTKLMKCLRTPYYSNEILVKDQLKNLIRHAESEKQAYEIDGRESLLFSYSKLKDNKYFQQFAKWLGKRSTAKEFYFDEKIAIMKDEFFKIIANERAENAQHLSVKS